MAIDVRPTVHIDGTRVACNADAVDTEPVAIRGFTITWGREEYQSPNTSPASVEITLLDTTDVWATRIRESQAIGLPVEIRWTGTASTDLTQIGPVTMFRGSVSEATAEPHSFETRDGRRGWEITLLCADSTAAFGRATSPWGSWPQENMLKRAARLRTLGIDAGSQIDHVYFWSQHTESSCSPLDIKGKTALELMTEMYQSMGNDTFAFDPDENVIRQATRLSQPMTTSLATFDDTRGAVLPVASDITVDGKVYPGIGLGGCDLVGTPKIHADPTTDINRVECSWKNAAAAHDDQTTIREDVQPGRQRRALAFASWFDQGEVIDLIIDNVWSRAREEGRRPRHPAFTFKPGFVFVSERVARWSLMAWENTRGAFISGDLAYQWLMGESTSYPPVVAPIGGQTTFDATRGWACLFHVHWIHNTSPPVSPATWASLQQIKTTFQEATVPWWYKLLGLPTPEPVAIGNPMPERDMKWGDASDSTGYHWDKSVTWGDTMHIPTSGTQVKDILD